MHYRELNDLQRDALVETFNIGVGRASRALAQMMGTDVAMSAPLIYQVEPTEVGTVVDSSLFGDRQVCSITRKLLGIDADAVLIFQGSEEAMRSSASGEINRSAPVYQSDPRESHCSKMGYLVIESCMDQIANVLGRNVERSPAQFLPRVPRGVFADRYEVFEPVIIVKIDLEMKRRGLRAHLLFGFTRKAANRLAQGLDGIIAESESAS